MAGRKIEPFALIAEYTDEGGGRFRGACGYPSSVSGRTWGAQAFTRPTEVASGSEHRRDEDARRPRVGGVERVQHEAQRVGVEHEPDVPHEVDRADVLQHDVLRV